MAEDIHQNIYERFIAFVSPEKALKRAIAREKLEIGLRNYNAASKGRRTNGWQASGASANTENRGSLALLRDRARDLTRNNPYAKRAIDVISTNTIGKGIMPTPIGQSDLELKRVKKAWKNWAETTQCDFNGRLNFYGIQKLVMRSVVESGEVLIRRKRVSPKVCPLGIQLQVLEADYLDLNKTISMIESGGYIIQGVEFDKAGKRIAYWLYQIHPGESSLTQPIKAYISVRVPADEIIHVFNTERPGQERGVPFGVSGMIRLRDFEEYEEAVLMQQKIAACYSAFITGADGDGLTNNNQKERELEHIEPGTIKYLSAGESVTVGSPPVTQNYGEYSRKMLQGAAMAYGTSYESFTGDLSNVNFSSGRMGWLEFHRNITDWQNNLIIPTLCNTTWQWFLDNAYIAGFVSKDKTEVNWTAPRREMIDPVKETTGITNQIRSGLRTLSEAIREQGFDPEEVLAEYAIDLKELDKFGIKLDCDMRTTMTQTVPPPVVGAKN